MGAWDTACAVIAEKQFGLISRDQAVRTGVSERAIGRRLGAGRWRQVPAWGLVLGSTHELGAVLEGRNSVGQRLGSRKEGAIISSCAGRRSGC